MNKRWSNFRVHYIIEKADNTFHGETGYLDETLLKKLVPNFLQSTVLTYGPSAYMSAVKQTLKKNNFEFEHYYDESFGDPAAQKSVKKANPGKIVAAGLASAENKLHETAKTSTQTSRVTFASSHITVNARHGENIVDIAMRAGVNIPTNCRMGLCGTCKNQSALGRNSKWKKTKVWKWMKKHRGMCCAAMQNRLGR